MTVRDASTEAFSRERSHGVGFERSAFAREQTKASTAVAPAHDLKQAPARTVCERSMKPGAQSRVERTIIRDMDHDGRVEQNDRMAPTCRVCLVRLDLSW